MTEKAGRIQAESSIARLQKTINNTSLKKHPLFLRIPHMSVRVIPPFGYAIQAD